MDVEIVQSTNFLGVANTHTRLENGTASRDFKNLFTQPPNTLSNFQLKLNGHTFFDNKIEINRSKQRARYIRGVLRTTSVYEDNPTLKVTLSDFWKK